jgi:ankyrin repeat protein
MACECGRIETCCVLLERNADINGRGRWGVVPLHFAAAPIFAENMLEMLQLLLDRGADPNARDDGGCTPLHYSSWWEEESFDPCHGTVEGSRLLLDHGADINAENNEGKTPLRVALNAGRHEMVDFLSSLGVQ